MSEKRSGEKQNQQSNAKKLKTNDPEDNPKLVPKVFVTEVINIPYDLRKKCLAKIHEQFARIHATNYSFDLIHESQTLEGSLAFESRDRAIYTNLVSNKIMALKREPVFNPVAINLDKNETANSSSAATGSKLSTAGVPQPKKKLLPSGITLTRLEGLCHAKHLLLANDYPLKLEDLNLDSDIIQEPLKPKQRCVRCGNDFNLKYQGTDFNGENFKGCRFHPKRLTYQREFNSQHVYTCCGKPADERGCTIGPHVFEMANYLSMLKTEGFDFLPTQPRPLPNNIEEVKEEEEKNEADLVMALDCEMCYTTTGLSLGRVSLLNGKGDIILDEHVKPDGEIIDYNTEFSGILPDSVEKAKYNFQEIQEKFLTLVSSDTILIGHSLESDLKVMRIQHDKVIDTSLLYPHPIGKKIKYGLKTLISKHLNQSIQSSESGHDSVEDARAALNLVYHFIKTN